MRHLLLVCFFAIWMLGNPLGVEAQGTEHPLQSAWQPPLTLENWEFLITAIPPIPNSQLAPPLSQADWKPFAQFNRPLTLERPFLLWLKVQIPDSIARDPHLLLSSQGKLDQVFIGQNLWTSNLDTPLSSQRQLTILQLPQDIVDKTLYLQMRSEKGKKVNISPIALGSPISIYLQLIKSSLFFLFVGGLILLMGFSFLFYSVYRLLLFHATFGILLVSIALLWITIAPVSTLFPHTKFFYTIACFLCGPALIAFYIRIFVNPWKYLFQWLWKGLVAYAILSPMLLFLIGVPQAQGLPWLYSLQGASLIFLLMTHLRFHWKQSAQATYFLLGIATLLVAGLLDVAPFHEWMPLGTFHVFWELPFFAVLMGLVFERHLHGIAEHNRLVQESSQRFVPTQFINHMDKTDLTQVSLGDHVEKEMTILFADMHSFEDISETMAPQEIFEFINAFLQCIEPSIQKNGGFIDKYFGDSITAFFSTPDEAVRAAHGMLLHLDELNQKRNRSGQLAVQLGIGINSGRMMLGTVGGEYRLEGTVISDVANLVSRIEERSVIYGASVIIGEDAFYRLKHPTPHIVRFLDRMQVKGKEGHVTIFEIYNHQMPQAATKAPLFEQFEAALAQYHLGRVELAQKMLEECLALDPSDIATRVYLDRCQQKAN